MIVKLLQALSLAVSLVAFGVLAGVWWALLVGGLVCAVLLELADVRGE